MNNALYLPPYVALITPLNIPSNRRCLILPGVFYIECFGQCLYPEIWVCRLLFDNMMIIMNISKNEGTTSRSFNWKKEKKKPKTSLLVTNHQRVRECDRCAAKLANIGIECSEVVDAWVGGAGYFECGIGRHEIGCGDGVLGMTNKKLLDNWLRKGVVLPYGPKIKFFKKYGLINIITLVFADCKSSRREIRYCRTRLTTVVYHTYRDEK